MEQASLRLSDADRSLKPTSGRFCYAEKLELRGCGFPKTVWWTLIAGFGKSDYQRLSSTRRCAGRIEPWSLSLVLSLCQATVRVLSGGQKRRVDIARALL